MVGELDVLVAGAGPAGSATALLLAQRGVRVALLERGAWGEPRVGESLAPAVQPLLRQLGCWERFGSIPHVRSYGVVSVWGDDEPRDHSYLSSVHGCGFHVERSAFDRMLADAAREAGAQLLEDTSVQRCSFALERFVVLASRAEGPLELRPRVLIDATGRRASIARQLGAERLLFDRAVAVAARFCGSDESHLLVEATPDGWFYSAPIAKDALSAMLMTDADLCASQSLAAALQRAPLTRARLGRSAGSATARVYCAQSQRLCRARAEQSDGAPWLAVGDAALAVDPIAGNGVWRALRSARAAADTVCELLASFASRASQRELLAAYDAACDEECTRYLVERAHYYAAERRFETPYWLRRTSAVERARTAGLM